MSKGKLGNRVKLAWLKSMEVLGTSASNLADNAKTKVAELNYESRRREILTEFSLKAFELWQKGVALPEPLSDMCQELSELDEKLSVLRAQKYAKLSSDGKNAPEQNADAAQADQSSEQNAAQADAPALIDQPQAESAASSYYEESKPDNSENQG